MYDVLTSVLAHIEVPFENGKIVGMWYVGNMVYTVGQSRMSTVDIFLLQEKITSMDVLFSCIQLTRMFYFIQCVVITVNVKLALESQYWTWVSI